MLEVAGGFGGKDRSKLGGNTRAEGAATRHSVNTRTLSCFGVASGCHQCQLKRPMAKDVDNTMKIQEAYHKALGQTCARNLLTMVR